MKKMCYLLAAILLLSLICGADGCVPEGAGTLNNTSIFDNSSEEIPIDLTDSASVEEIQQNAEQMLKDNICNLLPMQASRIPGDMMEVGVEAPEDMGNFITVGFPDYYLFKYNNQSYYDCFTRIYSDPKECLIPFTADLVDENGEVITTETGAVRLVFEGPLEELRDNPDYIPPTQDGPAPKNFQQITKLLTSTFTRTGCELQIDRPCEVPEDYSFCGQCSYSVTHGEQSYYRGKCWTCPSGTSCSGGDVNTHCAQVSCVSNQNSNNYKGITWQNYFASCSSCQTGPYSNYNYNGPDYYTCNYYYRVCGASQCADKRTNCA